MPEEKSQYVFRTSLPRPFYAPGSGIYAIVNRSNSKLYIGSAGLMNNRWCSHRNELDQNKHHSRHLQRAFNNDPEAFYIEVVEELPNASRETLIEREQFWMNFYRSYDRTNGYNISPTASSCKGIKHPPEYGRRISERQKGKPPTPLQVAAAMKRRGVPRPGMGRKFTKEQREEQRLRFLGRKQPEWLKKKLSEIHKSNPPRQTPVNQYDLDGRFIARHRNIKDAEIAIGFPRCGVQEACNGRNTHCRGFQWRYADSVNGEENIPPKPKRKFRDKKVEQLDLDGNLIAVHASFTKAAKMLGVNDTAIHLSIRNGGTCCGFKWRKV